MNLKTAILALVVLSMLGIPTAPAKGEEIQEIDLTVVDKGKFYLACSSDVASGCGIVSLWQEENKKPFLQKKPQTGAAGYARDLKLTL